MTTGMVGLPALFLEYCEDCDRTAFVWAPEGRANAYDPSECPSCQRMTMTMCAPALSLMQ